MLRSAVTRRRHRTAPRSSGGWSWCPWVRTDREGDARQTPRQRHQHLRGSVRRCVRGAPFQGARRPVFLNTITSSLLPSTSPLFSLAVRSQPRPPQPCARPPAAKGLCRMIRGACFDRQHLLCAGGGLVVKWRRVRRLWAGERSRTRESGFEMDSVHRHFSRNRPS